MADISTLEAIRRAAVAGKNYTDQALEEIECADDGEGNITMTYKPVIPPYQPPIPS